MRRRTVLLRIAWGIALYSLAVLGETPAAAGPTTAPDDPEQVDKQEIQARVVEVRGSVVHRSAGKGGEFRPLARGMMLPSDTVVSVGPNGRAVVSFGDNSVVVVEPFSVMTIAEVYQTRVDGKNTVVTRLKLVNGSVRAGVERGRTQSDFQISAPVATLSVRGTRPIRVFYDAGTAELWFELAKEGSMTARLLHGQRALSIGPGERTNQHLTLPIVLAVFQSRMLASDPLGRTPQDTRVQTFSGGSTNTFGGGNPQTVPSMLQTSGHVGGPNGGGPPGGGPGIAGPPGGGGQQPVVAGVVRRIVRRVRLRRH